MVDRVIEKVRNLEIPQRIADVVETIRTKVKVAQPSQTPADAAEKAFRAAIDRFAIAYVDVARMDGQPAMYQAVRLDKAGQDLERLRPETLQTLRSALKHDRQARVDTTTLKGPKRVDLLIAAIQRERAAMNDPVVRAQRFVARWNAQQVAYVAFDDDYRRIDERKEAIRNLNGLVRELAADKPMAAAIQANPARFGLGPTTPLAEAMRSQHPLQALEVSIERGFAPPSRGFSR